jgi:hypothetical protein
MLIENHKIDVTCAPEEHNKDNRKNRSDFFKIVFSNSIPLRLRVFARITLLSSAAEYIPLYELFGAALPIHGGRDDASRIAGPFPTGK